MAISTVIIKPTKACNAACTYCSAPPEVNAAEGWSPERFMGYFEKIRPRLSENAVLIWHGGEPMLMGPEFYRRSYAMAREVHPGIRFSMQTNLLLYDPRRWRGVFEDVFEGGVSTSFDPDERHREYKGSTALYTRIFMDRLNKAVDDGFRPMIIGTYTEETIHTAWRMYDLCTEWGERAPALRFNYRFPAGRDAGAMPAISPETYGRVLRELYDRWIVDLPDFTITPLDQMLKKTVGIESSRCPWLKNCGGHFLGIEPNGDVYNCAEFADLDDPEYRFGNLDEHDIAHIMSSSAARAIRRRRFDLPADCLTCRHFQECEGGCARDSALYGRGLGGKFFYCRSWMTVFDRIKESIRTGEADGALRKYGLEPDSVRARQPLLPEPV